MIKCTRPSADENTPTRNYNLRSMRAWRRPGFEATLQLQKTSQFSHLNAIAQSVGWRKLWDQALDHGPSCVKSVKNLVRIISYPDYATSGCPRCEITELDPPSLPAHIMVKHTNSDSSWDSLINSLVDMDPTFFSHVLCLLNMFSFFHLTFCPVYLLFLSDACPGGSV